MRITRTKKILAVVLLFNISFAGMCGKEDRIRTLAKGSDDFAQALKSTGELLQNAKSTGLISQEDVNEIKPFLQEAAKGNDEVIAYAQKLITNGDINNPSEQDELVNRINEISQTILRANQVGLTRIKNEQTRAAFSLLVATMNATITSVINTIRTVKK